MIYRAAKDNEGVVVCIGRDEDQSGAYHDMGEWCDFTFEEIPAIDSEVAALGMQVTRGVSLLKIENGQIVARSLAEVQADLE